MASRKELVEYDRTKQMTKSPDTEPSTPIITPNTTSTTSLIMSYADVQVTGCVPVSYNLINTYIIFTTFIHVINHCKYHTGYLN